MQTPDGLTASNVAQLRKRRHMTVRALSAAMGALGVPILPSGITKIEAGARRVSAGELAALSLALGANPNRLLLPARADDQPVALTPAVEVTARRAWGWADGRSPIFADSTPHPDQPDRDVSEELDEWGRAVRPADERLRETHPAASAARAVADAITQLLVSREDEARKPSSPRSIRRAILDEAPGELRRQLARLVAEVDAMIGGDDGR